MRGGPVSPGAQEPQPCHKAGALHMLKPGGGSGRATALLTFLWVGSNSIATCPRYSPPLRPLASFFGGTVAPRSRSTLHGAIIMPLGGWEN
jgi:hypothetical protein